MHAYDVVKFNVISLLSVLVNLSIEIITYIGKIFYQK